MFPQIASEGIINKEYLKYGPISGFVEWWKAHEAAFPYLSALAKIMLSIPPSSGSIERHFAESGVLITKRKAGMNSLTAEKNCLYMIILIC